MSHIFLNYDDVRGLVSALGKHRPRGRDQLDCQTFIAAALNTGSGLFIARLRFQSPIEGTGIQMTHEHVSKLSLAMTTRDLTTLRHTDRLEVVAGCLGWRADALMHHLKTTTGKLGRNESLVYETYLVENFNRRAGVEQTAKWTSIVRGGPGLYAVTGEAGNGVVHSYMASFLLAGAVEITDQESGLIVGRSRDNGERVYGMPVRAGDDLTRCCEIAANATVIVHFASRNLENAVSKLRDSAGFDASALKGMLFQTISRHNGEWKVELEIADKADLATLA
jgi:hypothetical protein